MSSFLLDICLGAELLDRKVILWNLEGLPDCFLKWLRHLHPHGQCVKVPISSIVLLVEEASIDFLSVLSILPIPVGVKCYLIVVVFDMHFSDDVESGLFLNAYMLGEEGVVDASKPQVG